MVLCPVVTEGKIRCNCHGADGLKMKVKHWFHQPKNWEEIQVLLKLV
jgi:hypothetical protein